MYNQLWCVLRDSNLKLRMCVCKSPYKPQIKIVLCILTRKLLRSCLQGRKQRITRKWCLFHFFYKKHRELKKFEDCVAPLADKCQDDPVYNMQVNQLKIFKPACGGVFDLIHLQHLRYMQMHDLKEFKDISKRNFGL